MLSEGFGLRLTSPVATADQQHRRMLWDDIRAAKEMLSRAPTIARNGPVTMTIGPPDDPPITTAPGG